MSASKATRHNVGGEMKFRHIPLPEPLPEDETIRAVWIGFEAARWFPFDPLIYLQRSAFAGSAAVLCGDNGGVAYFEPIHQNVEYQFLRGWHNGCPGAAEMVIQALNENPEIRSAHESLAALTVAERA